MPVVQAGLPAARSRRNQPPAAGAPAAPADPAGAAGSFPSFACMTLGLVPRREPLARSSKVARRAIRGHFLRIIDWKAQSHDLPKTLASSGAVGARGNLCTSPKVMRHFGKKLQGGPERQLARTAWPGQSRPGASIAAPSHQAPDIVTTDWAIGPRRSPRCPRSCAEAPAGWPAPHRMSWAKALTRLRRGSLRRSPRSSQGPYAVTPRTLSTSTSMSRTKMCCGQAVSQRPHLTQSAGPGWRRTIWR